MKTAALIFAAALGIASQTASADTPVQMVINGKAYTATVTDTAEGRNFLGMLPLHVRISRGEHDFCGDNAASSRIQNPCEKRLPEPRHCLLGPGA